MRILYIVPYIPNLIRVRPYNLIRHLAARGHEVTVLTLWTTEQGQNRLTPYPSSGYKAFRNPDTRPV